MLYQHQIEGADWLASRPKAYLGDVPGLGKTRTTIAALHNAGARAPLIVCPAIVRTHWAQEFGRLGFENGRGDYPIIASYDAIVRGGYALMQRLIEFNKIDALVLDEAHYLKHPDSKRTKFLLGKDGYARRLERVIAASGTPLPKHAGEFWTVLSRLRPEIALAHGLRSRQDFISRFCVTRGRMIRGHWVEKVVGTQREDELKEILAAVMLRRTLDDVGIDVPRIWWQQIPLRGVSPGAEFEALQSTVYGAIDAGVLDSIAQDPHVARMRRRLGELKAPLVAEMLIEQLTESDEKVVVMAHHRSVLHALYDRLDGAGLVPAYIDGDSTPGKRDLEITGFQTDSRCRVFIGQTIACQTGITLTAASRVVLVEPDWTAVVNQQAAARVARIGQTADRCIAQMISLAGTLDDAIVAQNKRETEMAERVLA